VAALTPRVVRTLRGPVQVAEVGTGPALLVVHGMPGDWRQARTVATDLADRARVLLVTRPGYGRTPLRSGRTPEEQAHLYAALLDAVGVDRAVVLGISGGGPSAYALAALHPDRCAGLVLACPVRSGVMAVPVAMRRLAAVPGLWSALAALARGHEAVRRARGLTRPVDLALLTEAERPLLDDPGVRAAAETFESERRHTVRGRGLRNDALRLGTAPPPWPDADLPVVVLHGALDEVVPVENATAYGDAVPGARVVVLPGLGHAVPVFARALLADELRAMLVGSTT
jgi:pimeloyl-ACP methyl ester carboxylesterase